MGLNFHHQSYAQLGTVFALALSLHPFSEKAMAPHSSTLAWKIPWVEEPGRLQSMGSLRVGYDWATSVSLFTFHFHALEKETATHSSVLAWRIPGTGEPGGLLSMGLHRIGHDWSDLAAASFFLELFLHCSPVAYWAPIDLGSSSFSVISFCLFIPFILIQLRSRNKWRKAYWSRLSWEFEVACDIYLDVAWHNMSGHGLTGSYPWEV